MSADRRMENAIDPIAEAILGQYLNAVEVGCVSDIDLKRAPGAIATACVGERCEVSHRFVELRFELAVVHRFLADD